MGEKDGGGDSEYMIADGLVLNARHPRHLHVNWEDTPGVSGSCAPPSERGPF
jgi:hypothetical protein